MKMLVEQDSFIFLFGEYAWLRELFVMALRNLVARPWSVAAIGKANKAVYLLYISKRLQRTKEFYQEKKERL
jgi:hypothetical protein